MRDHRTLALLAFLVLWSCAPAPAQHAKEARLSAELKRLTANYDRAAAAFYNPRDAKAKQAKTDADQQKIDYITGNPYFQYAPKFRALEKRARGSETGVSALGWLLSNASAPYANQRVTGELLALVTSAYIRSPGLEQIASRIHYLYLRCGLKPIRDTLGILVQKSPHRKVRAAALFTLAQIQSDLYDGEQSLPESKRMLMEMRSKASKEDIKQLEDYIALIERNPIAEDSLRPLFVQVQKEYADTPYAKRADRYIYALDNLAIGKVAPDFEATDQDGKKFKLSDYRGKVVVVDFWGFW